MDKQTKGCVLVVDDSHFIRAQIRKAIEKEGYSVLEAESGEEVVKGVGTGYFDKNKIDLIVLDVAMPKIDGIMTAITLKNSPYANIPIIFNSAVDDKGTVIKAIKVGGADYVIKSGHLDLLIGKVNKTIEKSNLVQLKIGEEKLVFDFHTYLKLEVSLAKRAKQPISVLILSMKEDGKNPFPEAAITEGINAAKSKLRDIDTVIRFGPANIFFIFPVTGKEGLKVVEKKVLDIIGGHKFTSLGDKTPAISFKAGRAVFPDDADTWETLLERAQEEL
ncbi:MAG: response regulator [Nitrospinae bacterium]|nr:response regulator [Nitrospinota bacterium]MBI3813671.1 response regulator [Nitrospinota bacterium]